MNEQLNVNEEPRIKELEKQLAEALGEIKGLRQLVNDCHVIAGQLETERNESRAEIERLKRSEYAYENIEEYEHIIGLKVNEAFSLGWTMARTKMSHLLALAAERGEG